MAHFCRGKRKCCKNEPNSRWSNFTFCCQTERAPICLQPRRVHFALFEYNPRRSAMVSVCAIVLLLLTLVCSGEMTETPRKKKSVDSPTENHHKRSSLFATDNSETFPPLSSTPFVVKNGLNSSVYESPISPLYRQNASFSSKKTNSMCLGDFIVQNRKSTGRKKDKSRRINPTCLTERKGNFGKCQNSFDFKREVEELPVDGGRNVLMEQCLKIVSRGVPPKTITNKSFCLEKDKSGSAVDINLVTQREKLDVAIRVYSAILRHNLALNLSTELYFLVCLLFRKHFNKNNDENIDGIAVLNASDCGLAAILTKPASFAAIFQSIHNVIYFAVKTIENLADFFEIFDKPTLKLLAEHKHLSTLSAELSAKLTAFSAKKAETPPEVFNDPSEVNVCFISDTDNRENFPNDQSFSAFRKQRDLFYEILRVWEKNHLMGGWSFKLALGGKIRALLGLHHEAVNFMHLARLFKNQLLSTYERQNVVSTTFFKL